MRSAFILAFLFLSACSASMQSASNSSVSASNLDSNNDDPGTQTPTTPSTPNTPSVPSQPSQSSAKCGLQTNTSNLAFCETFDAPSPIAGRSGQLNQRLWGVSRGGLGLNIGTAWPLADARIDACGTMMDATAGTDIKICNGQLREVIDDNITGDGGVAMMTLYPKQPFDFSGRVGTVAFDVSNDSFGSHSAWPEFWMTDQPVPLPIIHFSVMGAPANGFGVRFEAWAEANQYGVCPNGDNLDKRRFTVGSAVVVRDWFVEDVGGTDCRGGGEQPSVCINTGMTIERHNCLVSSSGPNGGLNHIEIKVSQNMIEVYGTDAGTTTPLKKVATIRNANLTLSRGFIWLEDKHYNADKGPEGPTTPSQQNHTFAWDNVAFDGPVVARDLAFDVVDSLIIGPGYRTLGYSSQADRPANLTTQPIAAADLVAAKTGSLLFNFYHREIPTVITYSINGHVHNVTLPFPELRDYASRTISLPVPLTDLVMGPNKIVIFADRAMDVANVSISLAGAGGIVNPR